MIMIALSCASRPTFKSDSETVAIYNNGQLVVEKWQLSKDHSPDIFFASLDGEEKKKVTFKSRQGEYQVEIADGEVKDFDIYFKGDYYWQRVIGEEVRPKATFSLSYQKEKQGKIEVSVPKAYELINIAIAISDFGQTRDGIIQKDTPYYQEVLNWFYRYRNHPFIKEVDTLCRADIWMYFNLKKSGNSVYFYGQDLKRSEVFGSTSFLSNNILAPYLSLMEDFAHKSKFHIFYQEHLPYYQELENFYENEIELSAMMSWLHKNYPQSKPYNYTHVIFSPLVGANQSLVSFEANGFSELQPHVNFTHAHLFDEFNDTMTPEEIAFYRGAIIFTEINHGFIGQLANKYRETILAATSEQRKWASPQMLKLYGGGTALFDEYINWALVPLYAYDQLGDAGARKILRLVNKKMTYKRGFHQFTDFMNFLYPLYKEQRGKPLAEAYPKIIDWFKSNNNEER